MHDTLHDTVAHPSCASPPPFPVRAPLPPVSPPRCAPWFYPVFGGCAAWRGWGGGALDAGSGPSLREFPHGGADACTPRQGVTLLYGPSICTRFVHMDLRRNQVRRPFPTPGSGTLWVAGESLRDRRVSCLPRWTVCPTRSPSQDTNRSTCRGERSWSGPLATPPGRCHLGPLANGPGRNPPYCLRSGGADTDTGGAPKPLRSGTSPASLAGSCHPGPPPFAAVLVHASPLSSPGFPPFPRPVPRSLVPAVPRPSLLSFPAVARCLAFFFPGRALATWRLHRLPPVSPPGVLVCPPPPPMSPRCPLAVLAPFLGGWRGGGRGGAPLLSVLWRMHVASTVQARGAALVPLRGGGLPCGPLRRPSYPVFAPPVVPPLGACTARAPYGHGRVVRPAPSLCCLPTLPLCPRGARIPPPSTFFPHPWGGGGVCVWGGGRPCCLSSVARMLQARCKHDASTR